MQLPVFVNYPLLGSFGIALGNARNINAKPVAAATTYLRETVLAERSQSNDLDVPV